MMLSNEELTVAVNNLLIKECGPLALKRFGESMKIIEPRDRPLDPYNFSTPADKEIQDKIKKRLKEITPDFGFMGEESEHINCLEKKTWIVDPIDGTFAFKNGLDSWGISVGLIEEKSNGTLENLFGSVYFPRKDRLLFSEGGNSYEISTASKESAKTNVIFPIKQKDLSKNNIITIGNHKKRISEFLTDELRYEMPGSYVAQILGVINGQYLGTIMRARIWDIAGFHSIAKNVGVRVYDIRTKQEIDDFRKEDFIEKGEYSWKLKKTHLVCYDFIKDTLFSKLKTNP